MSFVLQPWHLLVGILAGWINRQQQEEIEYCRATIQVLVEKLGPKRILLNDDQRRRLAVKGKVLGRKRLQEIGGLFTPDTLLAGTGNSSPRNGTTATGDRKRPGGRR